MSGKTLHVYSVCFTKYDSSTQLHGCLSKIRKNFFENGVSEKQVIIDETNGISAKYSYYISHWGMGWKKMVGDCLMEYSVPEQNGTAILFQDGAANPYAKAVYSSDLEWIRTCYYDSNTGRQTYSLELVDDRGVMLLQQYDEYGRVLKETRLYPGYSDIHSDVQDVLNEVSGKPTVYAVTNRGEVCFCTAEQARLRGNAMEDLEPELSSMQVEDMMVATFDWDDRGAQLFAECVLLLRGENPEERPDEVEALMMSTSGEQDQNISEELEKTIRETKEWLAQIGTSEESAAEDLFSYSEAEDYENDQDVAEIMSIIHAMELENQPAVKEKSLKKELETYQQAGHKMPTRYMVAGKKTNSRTAHAADVLTQKRNRAV